MKLDLTELMRLNARTGDIRDNISNVLVSFILELDDITSNINSSGLREANLNVKNNIRDTSTRLRENLTLLESFMTAQINSYSVSNETALNSLASLSALIDGVIAEDGSIIQSTEQYKNNASGVVGGVDVSIYTSNAASGFEVTTGNKTYQLSETDYNNLCALVAAEAGPGSADDALAVVTTILNRCESQKWNNYVYAWTGNDPTNPIAQISAPDQFSAYGNKNYNYFLANGAPQHVQDAVTAALNGVRSHDYLSFRSNGSYGYSDNMISSNGNRYL